MRIGWLLLTLSLPARAQSPCVPLPTCGDPGAPAHGCASPTPVLAWDDVDPLKVDGQHVYWRYAGTSGWSASQMFTLPCITWFDQDSMLWFKYCHGRSVQTPTQRIVVASKVALEFMVRNYVNQSQGPVESSDSGIVSVCDSPVWPGAPASYN